MAKVRWAVSRPQKVGQVGSGKLGTFGRTEVGKSLNARVRWIGVNPFVSDGPLVSQYLVWSP